MFQFTGHKSVSKKTYVLIFDPASQKATLEPLDTTYTFNLTSQNGADVPGAKYPHIYPRKALESDDPAADDDLFDQGGDDDDGAPDPDNPFDFRHFLGAVAGARDRDKRGDDSEYTSNSPDYRTGTGSAMNTPLMGARKPAPTAAPPAKPKARPKAAAQAAPKGRKRKSPEPGPGPAKKSAAAATTTTKKQQQAPPTVRIDRRASTHPKPETASASTASKAKKPASGAGIQASKIKSAEIVHSSDDSDMEVQSAASSPAHVRRSPSPALHSYPSDDEGEREDEEEKGRDQAGGLEIEVPDARPPKRALASLGLGQSLGLGSLSYLKSPDPSRGPISLVSAANSVDGSPDLRASHAQDEYDFGDIGGDYDEDEDGDGEVDEEDERGGGERDGDVEPMDIGPPAQSRKMSVGGLVQDEEEEDPLYREMMAGLAGGDSSEESEEE